MASVDRRGRHAFHELPLVLFSALATTAAGVGTGHGLLVALQLSPLGAEQGFLALAALLYGAGLAVSTGHLGRPLRAPRALARVGSSPLSNEVVVVGAAFALTALAAWAPVPEGVRSWLVVGAVTTAFLTLLSLGLVYRLPGQLTWSGAAVVQPLVLGTATGVVLHLAFHPAVGGPAAAALAAGILGADVVLVGLAAGRAGKAQGSGEPAHPGLWRLRDRLFLLRVLLGGLGPLAALLLDAEIPALVLLLMATALDRIIFYGLSVRWTVESEVSRAEEVLAEL
jgi:DMSO reductase anchor subunit